LENPRRRKNGSPDIGRSNFYELNLSLEGKPLSGFPSILRTALAREAEGPSANLSYTPEFPGVQTRLRPFQPLPISRWHPARMRPTARRRLLECGPRRNNLGQALGEPRGGNATDGIVAEGWASQGDLDRLVACAFSSRSIRNCTSPGARSATLIGKPLLSRNRSMRVFSALTVARNASIPRARA